MSQSNDASIPTANSAVDKQITPSGDSVCSDSNEPTKQAADEQNESKDSTPGSAILREADQGCSEEKLSIHEEQKITSRVALEQASLGNENLEQIIKPAGKPEQDFSSVSEHPSADRSDHEDVNKVSSLEDSDSHVVQSKTDCPKESEVVNPNKPEYIKWTSTYPCILTAHRPLLSGIQSRKTAPAFSLKTISAPRWPTA